MPNLTIEPAGGGNTGGHRHPVDCHLTDKRGPRWGSHAICQAGAYNVWRAEATDNPGRRGPRCRTAGPKPGDISVKLRGPLGNHLDILPHFDTLLVMSGRATMTGFHSQVLSKVRAVPRWSTQASDDPGRGSRRGDIAR